jgi:hypothetical protein
MKWLTLFLLLALAPRCHAQQQKQFRSALFLPGLVNVWHLEDTSDAIGGNTLTTHGNAFVTGRIGNAVECLSGSLQYLSTANTAPLAFGNFDWTWTLWVFLYSFPGSGGEFEVLAKDAASGRDFVVQIANWATPANAAGVTFFNSGGANFGAASSAATITNAWQFIAVWHVAATKQVSISLNNGPATTTTYTGTQALTAGGEMDIGRRAYAGAESYTNGRIDEVQMWKRALSPNEITRLYASGRGTTYPRSK